MRAPISWLSDFVELSDDIDALAGGLTAQGLKVEAVERFGAGIEGVLVGEVLKVEPHPNADRLVLVEVNLGEETRSIVCGARNFRPGDRVPVSLPGTRVPKLGVIERRKVRGEMSDGMLCSSWELGLGEDHDGIMVLPAGAPLGADIREALGLGEGVLVFDVTPNRPDAMSLMGVAREIAALTGAPVTPPEAVIAEKGAAASDSVSVEIVDTEGCTRYLARVVRGIEVGPSPPWVSARLAAAGVRSVSNVVDATNYALWITGHPMHAFDLATIEGGRIVVRGANEGEEIVTIDGESRSLVPDDLVIADADRALALAGLMGGIDTEVSDRTKDLLLESAVFDPRRIRRGSQRHGLRTEASTRFERGADPEAAPEAAALACRLIAEWAGGEVAQGAVDVYPRPYEPIVVTLRPSRVNEVLGTKLSPAEMASALTRLDLPVAEQGGSFRVSVPSQRRDLAIEEDLIEEIARIIGYEAIPSTLPAGPGRHGRSTRERRLQRAVREALLGAGISETYTSSFISEAVYRRMGYGSAEGGGDALRIANPLSEEEALLRPSLIPGLLAALARNVARRRLEVRFFEIGKCFQRSGEKMPKEPLRLGIVMHGPTPPAWDRPGGVLDFYEMKGAVEGLLEELRIPAEWEASKLPSLHASRTARMLVNGAEIGWLGEISSEVAASYDLTHPAYAAEIDLESLFDAAAESRNPKGPPKFPAVLLDLAVSLPDEVPAAGVLAVAREVGGRELESIRLFDVYTGEQIEEGRKSLAMALSFRREDRTMEEGEALALRDLIAEALASRLAGRLR